LLHCKFKHELTWKRDEVIHVGWCCSRSSHPIRWQQNSSLDSVVYRELLKWKTPLQAWTDEKALPSRL